MSGTLNYQRKQLLKLMKKVEEKGKEIVRFVMFHLFIQYILREFTKAQ
jgi:hypothetical protein